MRKLLSALLLLVLLAACSRQNDLRGLPEMAQMVSTPKPGAAGGYLAIQHAIHIDVEEGRIAAVYNAAQAACRAAAADHCAVLEARLKTGRDAEATLKFRAKPAGIVKLKAALSKQAEITEQSTSAEDLAGPITDNARKLAMLKDYRAKLEALSARASSDVDALIKVSRELSEVQANLEEMTGTQAKLMERVETEILDVEISPGRNRSFGNAIGLALGDFGSNLSNGVAAAITGFAFLLPWLVVFAVLGWMVRKLWSRRKRKV